MIGKTISHYRILDKLGEGGMGVVYLAEDTRLKRTVALKFLPPRLLATDDEKRRFINEAQTAARLDHPNICTIYEIDTADGQTYISMAYIPGQNLETKISSAPLDIQDAVRFAVELCGALGEAHSQAVTHRDVKPANIMISDKGRAVLLDFGLAKLKGQTRITRTGSTMGTSAYMSPEQVRGDAVDHRTDIWSLGVVLYQAVTGRLPFDGEHEAAVLYAIVNSEPAPVRTLRTGIPEKLEQIIEKSLAKDPDRRYQNIADLRADLETLITESTGPRATATSRVEPKSKPNRRALWGWIIGALAVIVIGAVFWIRPLPNEPQTQKPQRSTVTRQTGPLTDQIQKSIAVLPLTNLSRDSSNEFFVDGMTEELITQLAQIKALKVISSTSIMRYKDSDKPLPTIGRELGVGTIIEGSVLWAGDKVRISVQLVDATKDRHIWAKSYESDLSDVLGLQRRVAMEVANEIEVELTDQEESRLATAPIVNKEAYELYLQGRFNWNQRRPESIERAIAYYERAIAIDSTYALAYAGLAESYVVLATWGYDARVRRAHVMAREMAQKALSLDEGLAQAHACLAAVSYEHDWDWDQAEIHFKRAIELNPNYATAHQWYAEFLTSLGRYGEAVREIRTAQALDPLSLIIGTVAGFALTLDGDTDQGFAEFNKVIDTDPSFPPVYLTEQYSYYWIREWEKGARAGIKYLELTAPPDQRREGVMEIKAALDSGGVKAFDRASLAFLKRTYRESYVSPTLIASVFARLDEPDSAMVWLERAYNLRDHQMATMTRDRSFESLRTDPRYVALLEKLHLGYILNTD